MMRALSTAGTGMVAQQNNLDVISNNLANVNTTGFKGLRAEFQDLMYQTLKSATVSASGSAASPVAMQVGLGTQFTGTATDFTQGPVQQTGNPLDLAINGAGFFKVLLPDGTFAYTRDGSFKTDSTGKVVTSDGNPLDPEITIPKNATSISVGANGVITAITPDDPANAKTLDPPINVTMFQNPSGLTRMGQNLYRATEASGAATDGTAGQNGTGLLLAGSLEGSNVQVVQEMTRMILAQRAYEINSKAIQTSDDMLSTINNLKR